MKTTLTLFFALLLGPLAALHAGDDSKPSLELKPGTRMILKFPELPQTLYAMQSGQEAVTQAYLALPENYSPERKFPLIVFLYGGHGGPGAGPGRGQQIMENKDCIFVNLPLFKKKIDPDGPFKGLLISTEQDGETICRAYTAMLKKVYATIPTIPTTSALCRSAGCQKSPSSWRLIISLMKSKPHRDSVRPIT